MLGHRQSNARRLVEVCTYVWYCCLNFLGTVICGVRTIGCIVIEAGVWGNSQMKVGQVNRGYPSSPNRSQNGHLPLHNCGYVRILSNLSYTTYGRYVYVNNATYVAKQLSNRKCAVRLFEQDYTTTIIKFIIIHCLIIRSVVMIGYQIEAATERRRA